MRRAGPLVWVGFEGLSPPDDVLARVRDGDVGGVTLFARNIRDARQTRDLVRALHEARRVPIAVDQEGGNVVRIGFGTVFPSAMAFGATRDPELVARAAEMVARELKALGIGVLLAPVCDVNVEPRNPAVGTRAFSDEPALCATLAAAFVRAAQGAGVACTAKHFPGHGATDVDSHDEAPEVGEDLGVLSRRELVPFSAAIEAGVEQVMIAHVRYPSIADRVATFSAAIVTKLLRGKLGFDGLACSDDLDMAAARLAGGSASAAAIAAGLDVAHVSHWESYDEAIDGIERACARGEIATERIADALRRVRVFAARRTFDPSEEILAPSHDLAREVAARAITHVGPPLPDLRRGPLVCALFAPRGVSQVEELRDPVGALERALRARFGERLTLARDAASLAVPPDAPLLIFTSSAFFDREQAERARRLAAHRPAVLCAMRSPYDATLVPELPALLTYGDVPASCEALADVLGGARAPEGVLPVRLASS